MTTFGNTKRDTAKAKKLGKILKTETNKSNKKLEN